MSDFEFLVMSLRADAEMQLGVLSQGEEKHEANLPLSRKLIDVLAMLQQKTKGNLSFEEQRLLDNTVTELRFRYLQTYEAHHKKAAETGANG